MNAFQALLCFALVAASCAATLETAVNSENGGKSDQDTKVRAAVVLLSKTIEDWLDANPDEDPSETLTHLGKLLEEADVTEALAEEDDEGREPDSDVTEYGFEQPRRKTNSHKDLAEAPKARSLLWRKVRSERPYEGSRADCHYLGTAICVKERADNGDNTSALESYHKTLTKAGKMLVTLGQVLQGKDVIADDKENVADFIDALKILESSEVVLDEKSSKYLFKRVRHVLEHIAKVLAISKIAGVVAGAVA